MMKINLSGTEKKLGESIPFNFVANAAEIDAIHDTYTFDGDILVKGEYVNTGRGYRFSGSISCNRSFVCDRCLEPATHEEIHEFSEEFQPVGSKGADNKDEGRIVNYYDGDTIDFGVVIRDILLSDQPLNNICNADCRGLCLKCGANLNHGDCGCDRTVIDPRLAALQQLLIKK